MPDTECWTIGFAGKGDIASDHAYELLDLWMPRTAEIQVLLPERIPRTHKGLQSVSKLLGPSDFDLPYEATDEMITRLAKAAAQGEYTALVVLGLDDGGELATEALEAGVPVKDLCAALDDVEFAKDEPEPEPPATVQAEVAGPATITPVTYEVPQPDGVQAAAKLLETAIRTIIKEELAMFPGVHPRIDNIQGTAPDRLPSREEVEAADPEPEPAPIHAYVNPDGKYRLATKRSRKKADEEEVELTQADAREAGLIQ